MKNFEKALKELKSLSLPSQQYVIVGSGCLAAHNLRDCSDLDIIVIKQLWNNLLFKFPLTKYSDYEVISINSIEILGKGSHYLKNGFSIVPDLITKSTKYNGFNIAPLEFIKQIKIERNLPKDLIDVELIDEYLGLHTVI